MVALERKPQSLGQILQVNARFGRLLLEERLAAGRSVRSIASKVKIKRESLKKWESGKASPPARTFMAIMRIYGREALSHATELDFKIQIEKYDLVSKKIKSIKQDTKFVPISEQLPAA